MIDATTGTFQTDSLSMTITDHEFVDLATPTRADADACLPARRARAVSGHPALFGNLPGHRPDPAHGGVARGAWLRRGRAGDLSRVRARRAPRSPTTAPGRTAATHSRPPSRSKPTTPTRAPCSISRTRIPPRTGKLGAMGICIGGHLAFRAAMNPEVLADDLLLRDRHPQARPRRRHERQLARPHPAKSRANC